MKNRSSVVAGAFVTQFVVIGVLISMGLFIKVFEQEFGWSRTLVSSANALAMLMMGVLALFGGRLSDRFGPRIVLTVSALLFGLGLAGLSQISAPWQFFLLMGTLVAAGLGTHDVVTLSTIAHWFDKRRGVMTAVVKVGTALGQVTVPLIIAALIAGVGWRSTFLTIGAASAIILVIAASLMRYPSDGEGPVGSGATSHNGMTQDQARKTRTFWMMCLIQFLFFSTLTSVPLHLAPHGMDLGLTTARAATLISVMGAASIAGRLVVGALIDRIGCRNALSVCFVVLIAALLCFSVGASPSLLYANTAAYGFSHGALFVVVSPTVAYYFGMRAHGALFGTVLFFGTIGGAIGPIAMGAAFDLLGSYTAAFLTLAGLVSIALILARNLPIESEQARET